MGIERAGKSFFFRHVTVEDDDLQIGRVVGRLLQTAAVVKRALGTVR